MKSTLNKTDDVNGTIVIELERADFQEKVDKSLNQYRQKANIPGFRQGKIPKNLIRKLYGKAVLADEINKILSDGVNNFIRDNNIKILGEPLPVKDPDKQPDLENDEILTFSFDVALTPQFELKLDKSIEVPSYKIRLEPEMLEQQLDAYRQNYGMYDTIEDEIRETDLVKGWLIEMDGGDEKEDGQVIEDAILMPSYLKDEEIKNNFVGAKAGESVIFNPKKAYDDNEAEIASLLQTTKENVAGINADFRFDIKEVTRYKEADLDQELFDKVLGEGAVATEEEFRAKVEEKMLKPLEKDINHLFVHEVQDIIVKMMDEVPFPEERLKRWFLEANEKQTPEEIEGNFPNIVKELKYHVAKQKIMEENGFKVEYEEIEDLAEEVTRAQFAQYGMTNLPDDILQKYYKKLLSNEESVQNLYDGVLNNKFVDWLKENLTVIEEEISSKEFGELMKSHMQQHDGHAEEPARDEGAEETATGNGAADDTAQPVPGDTPAAGDETELTGKPE